MCLAIVATPRLRAPQPRPHPLQASPHKAGTTPPHVLADRPGLRPSRPSCLWPVSRPRPPPRHSHAPSPRASPRSSALAPPSTLVLPERSAKVRLLQQGQVPSAPSHQAGLGRWVSRPRGRPLLSLEKHSRVWELGTGDILSGEIRLQA